MIAELAGLFVMALIGLCFCDLFLSPSVEGSHAEEKSRLGRREELLKQPSPHTPRKLWIWVGILWLVCPALLILFAIFIA